MPSSRAPSATASGVPPVRAIFSDASVISGGIPPPFCLTNATIASVAPLRSWRSSISTPLIFVYAEKGMNFALWAPTSRPRSRYFSFARTTIDRPSGVSSARLDNCAASASSPSVTPDAGRNSTA